MPVLDWMRPPAPAGGATQTSYTVTDHRGADSPKLPNLLHLQPYFRARTAKSSAKTGANSRSDALAPAWSRQRLVPTTLLEVIDLVIDPTLYRAIFPVF